MNCFFVTGNIITVPTSTFIRGESKEIYIVKFCLSVSDSYMSLNVKGNEEQECDYNFFQCVAFGDVGKQIVECYDRGIRVSLQAIVHNFLFKDSNGTPHCTDILLVNQIECTDSSSGFKIATRRKNINKVLVDEISHIEEVFKKICDQGFLCINEDDYYNIAISNMVI